MGNALEDQVALVTGGGRGIGRAIAKALTDEGAAVCVAARSKDEIEKVATSLSHEGARIRAIPLDVTDAAQVRHAVDVAEREFGPITLLVNNGATPGPVGADWEVDPDEWWRCIEVSVRGALLCARAVLPGMIDRGSGRIINVASQVGTRIQLGLMAISVAKTALIRFSEGLARQTDGRGVSVFAIHPGLVRTAATEYLIERPGIERWSPDLRRQLDEESAPPEAAGTLCVRLASGDCDRLSGCYMTIDDDVDALIAQADAIRENDLQVLRLRI